uniref:Importin subunit alpha n=1 Tax=Peronospora matthiolae TaxID=2874970 RepID=A0AAV1TH63_9STRA
MSSSFSSHNNSSSSSSSTISSHKAFLSPTDVAELTAAAVAALPSSLSQSNLSLKKSSSSAHRTENGDIVHHHQATHSGGNATLVTSTTTTIHHVGSAGKAGILDPVGGMGTAGALPPQSQFSLHSHNHRHHHHHHLSHGAGLLANGSLSGLADGSLGRNGLDGSIGLGALAPSPSFQGDLNQIDAGLNSEDADVQLEAAKKLRVLLSSERDLLIRQMLEKNWTPRLIKWLRLRDRPTLQVEALWALTNIAAGATDNTSVLLQNGVIPTLVSLLDSSNEEVLEQSVWVLGNLAGEGAATRDLVLSAGALTPLVNNLKKTSWDRLSLLRILTWTISNLCDGQPRPVFDIGLILPYLAKMLTSTDTEILSHICWAFSHLCDGPSTHIQAVVDSDVCFRLVELLSHSSWRVTKPALRAIGNIVCAEDDHDYTQHIIECGAVPSLRRLIAHSNREIQKEACWTLSNIAAGTVDQIQCVLDSGCIPSLVGLAASDTTDAEVKSEACWVVLNATSCGSDSQIEYLVNQGCIQILGNLLEETSMVMMALEGLERILQVGELEAKRTDSPNPYASLMASANIETLVSHKSATVAKRATRIWQQHFVTCAICLGPFSKHSNDTFFCAECKCNVCKLCNCTVFHLKYQESLWKEETEKETHEKQARQASKRSKRQKKRQRTKERKAALLRGQKTPAGGRGSKQSRQQRDQPHDNSSSDDASSTKSGGGGVHRRHDADDSVSENGSNGSNVEEEDGGSTTPGDEEEVATDEEANADVLDEMVDANDKLVSYLLETGSIMALAERLDLEDDSMWIVAEKDRTAIHA